jgi:hypothetical protein
MIWASLRAPEKSHVCQPGGTQHAVALSAEWGIRNWK